jgi:hypothetical protein
MPECVKIHPGEREIQLGEGVMLYLVQVGASMERANQIDAGEGPGPVFSKVVERFKPEAFYGNPQSVRHSWW